MVGCSISKEIYASWMLIKMLTKVTGIFIKNIRKNMWIYNPIFAFFGKIVCGVLFNGYLNTWTASAAGR
jgi:hypothetical protein